MHPTFAKLLEGLHPKFEELMRMPPFAYGKLPKTMPKQGVYLFSEKGALPMSLTTSLPLCV